MSFFSEQVARVEHLHTLLGDAATAADLVPVTARLSDEGVLDLIRESSALIDAITNVRAVAAGVAATRSTRDLGHDGLAQRRGHRTPASLIQDLTGSTRGDAAKHLRVGQSLLESSLPPQTPPETDTTTPDVQAAAAPVTAVTVWHAGLDEALMTGTITTDQHDAISRGLGTPPTDTNNGPGVEATTDDATPTDDALSAAELSTRWSDAATRLVAEAAHRTVEELGRHARTIRDLLDPAGAQTRFNERFEHRSFRLWTDPDGARRASIIFDPHGGAWMQTILDTALRPRRGGPRFVDPAEKDHAEHLAADPRTNEQLQYDLIIDVLRAGTLADPETVFGTRQAGLRIVITDTARAADHAGHPAVALVEDDQQTLPAWLAATHACDTGTIDCTLDDHGNPLNLGRETRLFTPKQKIALALRDGGCRWHNCDRPASYCESHHIDPYSQGGRTDIDRGISLCRYHHMTLHNGHWHITRRGRGDFTLHPPGRGTPIVLEPRLSLTYAWTGIDPPPQHFRPAI
jgi:hypothetical protein